MERLPKSSLLLLLLLLLFACGPQAAKQQNLTSLFPESIGEWHQLKLISGSQALEKINHLHGKNIIVEAGAICIYQAAGKAQAMVWISRRKTYSLNPEQAEVMAEKMVNNPRSPFHNPETMSIKETKVYKFLGMGQVHYIFCRECLAYWISSPPADGKKLLLYFLEV